MSRRFTHQNNEAITVAPGTIGGIVGGPVTVITLWKPNSRVASGFITGYNASNGHVWNVNPYSDGQIYFGASGFTGSGVVWNAGDGWRIDAFTHDGSNGAVIHHKYLFSGGGWTTTTLGTVNNSAQGPCTYYLLGAYDNDEACDAWIGAQAVYASQLTTSNITTTGIESALSNWIALTPAAAWKFNVDDVASGAVDITGNGANETSHSGTSFTTDEPVGFSYSLSSGVSASATRSQSVALTASGATGKNASSPLSSTVAIGAQGATGVSSPASLAQSALIAAQGLVQRNSSVALAASALIAAQGLVTSGSTASLAASVAIAATSQVGGLNPEPPAELRLHATHVTALHCQHEVSLRWVP